MRAALTLAAIALPLALSLAGCNRNTATGNDREAQLDPAPSAAEIASATEALRNVSTALIKPETMSPADIAALGGLTGKCAVRLTEVAFPSFVYESGVRGVIKLNGKLIPLPATGQNSFRSGELGVTLLPNDEEGDAGLPAIDMIVVPPGAEDELGYAAFVECRDRGAS